MRFPGFEECWELKKLKEIASKINSGKTPLGGEAIYTVSGVVFIRSQNVNNDRLVLDNPVFIPDDINTGMKNSVVYPNDILLNITGASLGRSCVVPENFTIGNVNQHVCIIRSNNKYNPRFIQPILSSTKGQDVFKSLQTGSGREGLNFESIKNIKISHPSLTEQNKIAIFLSLLDNKLQTQKKIIRNLETLINGYGEKIFSQKMRFKDKNGDSFSHWEINTLKNVLIKNSSKNKSLKYLNVQSVSNKFGFINQEDFFEDRRVASINTSNYYIIEKGDFAYNPSRIDVGSLAYKFDANISIISPLYISFKANNNFLVDRYLLSWFSHLQFIRQMSNSFEGSVRNTLSYESLSKMSISLPSLQEQAKIEKFLYCIEEKIATEKKISAQYETQKKYLLANLFV